MRSIQPLGSKCPQNCRTHPRTIGKRILELRASDRDEWLSREDFLCRSRFAHTTIAAWRNTKRKNAQSETTARRQQRTTEARSAQTRTSRNGNTRETEDRRGKTKTLHRQEAKPVRDNTEECETLTHKTNEASWETCHNENQKRTNGKGNAVQWIPILQEN